MQIGTQCKRIWQHTQQRMISQSTSIGASVLRPNGFACEPEMWYPALTTADRNRVADGGVHLRVALIEWRLTYNGTSIISCKHPTTVEKLTQSPNLNKEQREEICAFWIHTKNQAWVWCQISIESPLPEKNELLEGNTVKESLTWAPWSKLLSWLHEWQCAHKGSKP
jgi:hypothetical protein